MRLITYPVSPGRGKNSRQTAGGIGTLENALANADNIKGAPWVKSKKG